VELGTRYTTERVQDGNSPPTVARAVFLPDYDEGLANHIGPEPCGGLREEADEKSVGARVGGVLRRESC
jgi:hypothetical protein